MSRNAKVSILTSETPTHTCTPGKKKSLIQTRKERQEAVE